MKKFLFLFLTAVLAFPLFTAYAESDCPTSYGEMDICIYVDRNNSSSTDLSGAGTFEKPFKTIKAAVRHAVSELTSHVKDDPKAAVIVIAQNNKTFPYQTSESVEVGDINTETKGTLHILGGYTLSDGQAVKTTRTRFDIDEASNGFSIFRILNLNAVIDGFHFDRPIWGQGEALPQNGAAIFVDTSNAAEVSVTINDNQFDDVQNFHEGAAVYAISNQDADNSLVFSDNVINNAYGGEETGGAFSVSGFDHVTLADNAISYASKKRDFRYSSFDISNADDIEITGNRFKDFIDFKAECKKDLVLDQNFFHDVSNFTLSQSGNCKVIITNNGLFKTGITVNVNGTDTILKAVNNTWVEGDTAFAVNGAVDLTSQAVVANNIYGNLDTPADIEADFESLSNITYNVTNALEGALEADPMFTGSTFDAKSHFSLQDGSPAINAGTGDLHHSVEDLLGNNRVKGSAIDIGAIENQNVPEPEEEDSQETAVLSCGAIFSDLKDFDPLCGDALILYNEGVLAGKDIEGSSKTMIDPDAILLRAEVIALSNRISKLEAVSYDVSTDGNMGFSDLDPYLDDQPEPFFLSEIKKAARASASGNAVIRGYADGTVRPTQEITRAEMWKIVLESALNAPDASIDLSADQSKSPWFSDYLDYVSANDLGSIANPLASVDRGEIIRFIAKIYAKGILQPVR